MRWLLYLLLNSLLLFCGSLSRDISLSQILVFLGLGSVWISEAWFIGNSRIRLYGPRFFVGMIGYILFFITPLLDYVRNVHIRYLKTPDNLALTIDSYLIHILAGSIIYKIILTFLSNKNKTLKNSQFAIREVFVASRTLSVTLIVPLIIFAGLYYDSILALWSTSRSNLANEASGFGIMVTLYTWFLLFFMVYSVSGLANQTRNMKAFFNFRVVSIFVFALIFLGWTGSRTTLLFFLIVYLKLFTYIIRPISPRENANLVIIFIGLLLVGSIFKAGGLSGFGNLLSGQWSFGYLSENFDRGILSLLRSDLSRSGVGSLLINNAETLGFQSLNGATYAASFLLFLRVITGDSFIEMTNYLPTVVGGGLLRGTTESFGELRDFSRAFGFPVEAYMNFGRVGMVLSFAAFAMLINLLDAKDKSNLKTLNIRSAIWNAVLAPIPPLLMLFDSTVIVSYITRFILPVFILQRVAQTIHAQHKFKLKFK